MIQDRLTQVALSKQTALASPAASGTYQTGVNGGAVGTVEIDESDIGTTWASAISEGFDRGAMTPGGNFELPAMRKSLGLLLLGALGSDTVTGSGPYTHTYRPTSVIPYLTLFARRDTEFYKISDARVKDLEFSWEGTKALMAKVSLVGCAYSFLASAYAAVNDERPKDGVQKGCGGTFTVDGAAAIIKSGSVKIETGAEAVHGSSSPLPADVSTAMTTITGSLTIVPNDQTLFRKVVTGTTSGTAVQCRPVTGALVCSWTDGTNTLAFNGLNVVFMTSFPDAKAAGGPVEVSLEFTAVVPTGGGDAATFVLVNDVATY